MATRLFFFFTLISCFLAACAIGPDYSRPNVALPAQYKEAAQGWKIAQPRDQYSRGSWWEVFHDATLDELITRATASNQQIASYAAAYREAQAWVRQMQAGATPKIDLTGNAMRTHTASTWSNTPEGGPPSNFAATRHAYTTSLEASWEPDLWRKIQRQVNGQNASAQSAQAELANAQLSVQTTLAQHYFELRMRDAQQTLIDTAIMAYQKALAITEQRYAQGMTTRTDVLQAQTQLSTVQAEALDNQLKRKYLEHALATLVGEPASTFSLAPAPLLAQLPYIPAQLPSALLERRPDIAAKERLVAAANEKIGIEMAGFFPTLTLSASSGFSSTVFSQWLSAPTHVWSLGPRLVAMLFDGGVQRARTAAARHAYEQNVAIYRQTVLTAFQEVEDQLATLHVLKSKVAAQQQAATSAQQALTLITNQYKAGMVSYLEVTQAQTTALSARSNCLEIEGSRMVATVALIKALGGGWATI